MELRVEVQVNSLKAQLNDGFFVHELGGSATSVIALHVMVGLRLWGLDGPYAVVIKLMQYLEGYGFAITQG